MLYTNIALYIVRHIVCIIQRIIIIIIIIRIYASLRVVRGAVNDNENGYRFKLNLISPVMLDYLHNVSKYTVNMIFVSVKLLLNNI